MWAFFKQKYLYTVFFLVILCLSILIHQYTKPANYDQINTVYNSDKYPLIDSGVTTHLLINVYSQLVKPDEVAGNVHIKTMAMVLYMVAFFLLINSIYKRNREKIFLLFLICFSGFPMLWLSTELIAGAFLALSILSILKKWNPILTSFIIVAMGFTRPEMIIIACFLLIYGFVIIYKKKGSRILLIGGGLITAMFLVLPGVAVYGSDYLKGQNRAFYSFGQHYAAIFSKHQIQEKAPHPWNQYDEYMKKIFPEADSFADVVLKYPRKYSEFVILSLFCGILKFVKLFHILIVLFFMNVLYLLRNRLKYKCTEMEKVIFLCFSGIAPVFIFSFPHIRYFGKYYPLILILLTNFILKLYDNRESKAGGYAVIVFAAYFVTNVVLFLNGILDSNAINDFWFPD